MLFLFVFEFGNVVFCFIFDVGVVARAFYHQTSECVGLSGVYFFLSDCIFYFGGVYHYHLRNVYFMERNAEIFDITFAHRLYGIPEIVPQ